MEWTSFNIDNVVGSNGKTRSGLTSLSKQGSNRKFLKLLFALFYVNCKMVVVGKFAICRVLQYICIYSGFSHNILHFQFFTKSRFILKVSNKYLNLGLFYHSGMTAELKARENTKDLYRNIS